MAKSNRTASENSSVGRRHLPRSGPASAPQSRSPIARKLHRLCGFRTGMSRAAAAAAAGRDDDVVQHEDGNVAPKTAQHQHHHHPLLVVIEADESQPLRQVVEIGSADPDRRSSFRAEPLEDLAAPTREGDDAGDDDDDGDTSTASYPDLLLGLDRKIAQILMVPIKRWVETLLVRPAFSNDKGAAGGAIASPGLVACHVPCSQGGADVRATLATTLPNVRATRLAMACGLLDLRFYGTVVLKTSTLPTHLKVSDVELAACVSPDLRLATDAVAAATIPEWLSCAAQHNYHDRAVLQRISNAMNRPPEVDDDSADEDDHHDNNARGDGSSLNGSDNGGIDDGSADEDSSSPLAAPSSKFVARSPLCLHCRRPAAMLCQGCHGAYFCAPANDVDPTSSSCQVQGWSHQCWCDTWKRYVSRRPELSTFDYLGPWVQHMTSRDCQLSQVAYETRLSELLLQLAADADDTATSESATASELRCLPPRSWWRAEYGAWKCGTNAHARHLNVLDRVSYDEGFAPLPSDMRPPDRPIRSQDVARLLQDGVVERNSLGLIKLHSWAEYYRLRNLPGSSPAALLLTFPLTLYWSIVEHGEVPCTVAHTILKRPLRIHIVGAEKELVFLDMFQETSYLLGSAENNTIRLELVLVVRSDMVPPSLRSSVATNNCELVLSDTLAVRLVSGTYGDPNSLDPHFDCGSGPPDMVVAFNAGLYAYESWRSVVTYLYEHPSVVGVLTDYNEMSASQCASLGGPQSRSTLKMNPFRQPRAMPVYSMNLPQFGNGFVYVYNPQTLE